MPETGIDEEATPQRDEIGFGPASDATEAAAPFDADDGAETRENPRAEETEPGAQGPVAQRPWSRSGPRRVESDSPIGWRVPHSAPISGDLVGADEELVAGRHPVEEAFLARRNARRLLVVSQRRQALEKLVLHAANLRIPIVEVEGGTLTSLAGFDGHQGIALVTDHRPFAGPEAILARAIERNEPAFVLVLDSLEDPQNFGSLLRTAEASGVHGVVFPTRHQAPLSSAAIKASAGAVEHLLLAPVDDLAEALTDFHVRGLRIVGTDAAAPLTAREADLRGPVVIVVGSEGQGLGPAVRRRCDVLVRIPMHGHVTSLNASVAGSILLYEAASQRDRPNGGVSISGPGTAAARVETDPESPEGPAGDIARESEAAAGVAEEAIAPTEEAAQPDSADEPIVEAAPATPRPRARPRAKASTSRDDADALLPGGPSAGQAGGSGKDPSGSNNADGDHGQ